MVQPLGIQGRGNPVGKKSSETPECSETGPLSISSHSCFPGTLSFPNSTNLNQPPPPSIANFERTKRICICLSPLPTPKAFSNFLHLELWLCIYIYSSHRTIPPPLPNQKFLSPFFLPLDIFTLFSASQNCT